MLWCMLALECPALLVNVTLVVCQAVSYIVLLPNYAVSLGIKIKAVLTLGRLFETAYNESEA